MGWSLMIANLIFIICVVLILSLIHSVLICMIVELLVCLNIPFTVNLNTDIHFLLLVRKVCFKSDTFVLLIKWFLNWGLFPFTEVIL